MLFALGMEDQEHGVNNEENFKRLAGAFPAERKTLRVHEGIGFADDHERHRGQKPAKAANSQDAANQNADILKWFHGLTLLNASHSFSKCQSPVSRR